MEESPQMEQLITSLRAAYAAFNRGDVDAAVEPLDTQIEWSEHPNFREVVRITDARARSTTLPNHGLPGLK
jgi:hypothetical protein